MAQHNFSLPSTLINPDTLTASPSTNPNEGVRNVSVILVDTNSQWATRTGTIVLWGIQIDRGDGAGFVWWQSNGGVPFGALDRGGHMPSLTVGASSLDLEPNNADYRIALLTDPSSQSIRLGVNVTLSK